jgi:hypothetical protein
MGHLPHDDLKSRPTKPGFVRATMHEAIPARSATFTSRHASN